MGIFGFGKGKNTVPEVAPIKDKPKGMQPVEAQEAEKVLYVLDSSIPIKEAGPDTPSRESTKHYTLCKSNLAILEKVASAVELRDPCLLEGDTGTAKTSSIVYLASLSGHQIQRINLSGHTDTADLIGKFVPNTEGAKIAFEDLLRSLDSLHPESKLIVTRAQSEGRSLTVLESQKIATLEGLEVSDWRWQDGKLPLAMKQGHWIILDEINLAEPQVIERLNSVLEKHPTLTITENDGQKIAEGQTESPLHPDFRIFGTMNPAEFSGRSPMSPAGKDRWTSYAFVRNADAADYQAMLMHMVFGVHPEVEMNGVKYQQERSEPMVPELMNIYGMDKFLEVFSQFQIKIEEMARQREIGRGRKEKYVFTRRSMVEFIEFLSVKKVVDRKTGKKISIFEDPKTIILRGIKYYYLDKMVDADDLQKVEDLLDSLGIGKDKFLIDLITDKATVEKLKADQEMAKRQAEEAAAAAEIARQQAEAEEEKAEAEFIKAVEEKGIKIGVNVKISPTARAHTNDKGLVKSIQDKFRKVEIRLGGCVHSYDIDEFEVLTTSDGGGAETETTTEGIDEEKVFRGTGGLEIKSTGKTEHRGLRVGMLLKATAGDLIAEVQDAKKLELVGFTSAGEYIIRIDDGICVTGAAYGEPGKLQKYEIITTRTDPEATPTKSKEVKRVFVHKDSGTIVEYDGRTELGGIHVGTHVSLKNPERYSRRIQNAKEIDIVGVTSGDQLIIRIDSDDNNVFTVSQAEIYNDFEIKS